tara:strand:- start:37 stop:213 length:177 start_codon:yes stop_codon:yes gene_type:complete
MELEKIEITTIREKANMFSSIIKWDDGTQHATQGDNYPELIKHIGELLLVKMEDDKHQ